MIGTGFIGAPVVAGLVEAGYRVLALNRSGEAPAELRDAEFDTKVNWRAFDLLDDDAAAHLAPAAVWIACYASGGTQDRRALYVGGARKLAEAARHHQPGRVVYTSSTSALPEVDGEVDETSTGRPEGERGAVQRDAEDAWREGLSGIDRSIPLALLRLAGLYGPGRELGRLYLRSPRAVLSGDGHKATNLVHRDDAVAAILAAATRTPALDALVHVCDDDHRTRRSIVEALGARAAAPSPRFEEDPPPGPPRGKRVRNDAMKRLLGVVLRHPTHDPHSPG